MMCLRPTSTLLITGGDGRNELTDCRSPLTSSVGPLSGSVR
jgi:hypothetical protein